MFIYAYGYTQSSFIAFEKDTNHTATYTEMMNFYTKISKKHSTSKLYLSTIPTDIGKPLPLFVIDKDKDFSAEKSHQKGKLIVFINNGIHPGEPEGIDASMLYIRDILERDTLKNVLDKVVLVFVPCFNIDGMLNRSAYFRVNQNGPRECGFRGNAQNLDLNRDFIKTDAGNTRALIQYYHTWQPDILIDNHTSNGADYPYTLTYICTQKDKIHPLLGTYLNTIFCPQLNERLKKTGFETVPYVDLKNKTPESGIIGYLETPRYLSGYAAVFNTLSFVCETHVWKPFPKRVRATYQFMHQTVLLGISQVNKIKKFRKEAIFQTTTQKDFALQWKLDTTKVDTLPFKGYKAQTYKSNISGLEHYSYNPEQPYQKNIPYYNTYYSPVIVNAPLAYIIPQAWKRVIERLQWNKITLQTLPKDTVIELECYYIKNFNTVNYPYEGHYLHYNITTETKKKKVQFYAGDYICYVNQTQNRYIVETLEPQGVDSFFAWGFFDSILQQKEYPSSYMFEKTAEELLQKYPEIKEKLEEAKKTNPSMKESHIEQLNFIYKSSPYYEATHLLYPVYRIEK
jgi:hypothetical protein